MRLSPAMGAKPRVTVPSELPVAVKPLVTFGTESAEVKVGALLKTAVPVRAMSKEDSSASLLAMWMAAELLPSTVGE